MCALAAAITVLGIDVFVRGTVASDVQRMAQIVGTLGTRR